MAVDASSVSVVLGASSFGPGVVVTSAGVVFAQAASAPGASSDAYFYYNGTNLVGNVPASKGFSFTVNGSQIVGLSAVGSISPPVNQGLVWGGTTPAGGVSYVYSDASTLYLNAQSGSVRLLIGGSTDALRAIPVSATPLSLGGQVSAAHLTGGSTALTPGARCMIGLGAGTTSSGTAVTASGHDIAGRIGVTVNSTGTANQPILLVAFATAYNTPPFVLLTPGNAATATVPLATAPHAVATTSGFAVQGNATGIAAGTYVWQWQTVQ